MLLIVKQLTMTANISLHVGNHPGIRQCSTNSKRD